VNNTIRNDFSKHSYKIPLAQIVALDRWKVQLEQLDASTLVSSTPLYRETGFPIDRIFKTLFNDPKFTRETNRAGYENYQKLLNTRFINYMSFGFDAAIALEFFMINVLVIHLNFHHH
jgi:hypothetical protein